MVAVYTKLDFGRTILHTQPYTNFIVRRGLLFPFFINPVENDYSLR